jgi:CRISPR-associated protein Csb2
MLRYLANQPDFASALGWDKSKVDAFVLGHDNSEPNNTKPTANAARLVFIPLPSIEWHGEGHSHTVGPVRRVLVTIGGGNGQWDHIEFSRIIRALEGRELIDEKSHLPVAFLRRQSERENSIWPYLKTSSTWATITPVILPGHDDPRKLRRRLNADSPPPLTSTEKNELVRKLDARIEHLLRKSIVQAGIPETLARCAAVEWRSTGFWPGTDLASRYSVPDQHRRFRRVHVRITWRAPDGQPLKVVGPICLGGGRHTGLGLFAALPDS